ncbi:MAG: hypothetical protein AMXMBFR64_16590 [Myxococcales bacterium]
MKGSQPGAARPLVLRPGARVEAAHRQAITTAGVGPEKRVPSVGVLEVWASWARLNPDGSLTGSLRVRRVEQDEAGRLDELSRVIDSGDGRGQPSADDRARLEAIASRVNADLLRAAEELSEQPPRGRAALVRRCLSAMDGAPGSCTEEGIAALVNRVKNDDLRITERTRHAVLWLLLRDRNGGVAASDTSGDVVDWVLRHEEARGGLTGVIAACDELYREVTGHRPSSTLSSRVDRAGAMRYMVEATRVPTAPRPAARTMAAQAPQAVPGEELQSLRDQLKTLETRLEAAERGRQDALDTTRQLSDEVARLTVALEEARREGAHLRHEPPRRVETRAQVEQQEPPMSALEPAERPRSEPQPPAGAPVLAEPALAEPDPQPEAPLDDGFFDREVLEALPLEDPPAALPRPAPEPPRPGPRFATASRPSPQSFLDEHIGGDGRTRAIVVGIAIILLVAAAWVFVQRAASTDGAPPSPPAAGTSEPEERPAAVRKSPLGAQEPEAPTAPIEDVDVVEEAPENPTGSAEAPIDEPTGPAPAIDAPLFKPSLMLTTRSKAFVQGVKMAQQVEDLPGSDFVLRECVIAPSAASEEPTYRGYSPVKLLCDGKLRTFCRSLGCSDEAIVCHTRASALKPCSATVPVDPWEGVAPDEVTGKPPADFAPSFMIRTGSKVYAAGTGDAVPLETLPGVLEVEGRCVFAASTKERTRRRAVPGFEHLAIHCAGPRSALCKALACGAPGQLCHLVASGVKPCKLEDTPQP